MSFGLAAAERLQEAQQFEQDLICCEVFRTEAHHRSQL